MTSIEKLKKQDDIFNAVKCVDSILNIKNRSFKESTDSEKFNNAVIEAAMKYNIRFEFLKKVIKGKGR